MPQIDPTYFIFQNNSLSFWVVWPETEKNDFKAGKNVNHYATART
jgi:hypothetical protein